MYAFGPLEKDEDYIRATKLRKITLDTTSVAQFDCRRFNRGRGQNLTWASRPFEEQVGPCLPKVILNVRL